MFTFSTTLTWLNHGNKTGEIQHDYLQSIMENFPGEIIAAEVGSAYGGGVEMMAKVLLGRGKVYGFDTFVGHPRDLSDDPESHEATAMDFWYREDVAGTKKLAVEYQRKVLKNEGLDNATLVKGRVDAHSFDFLGQIHLAMLDLDLEKSTKIAYEGIKDKVIKGGYLFMHDAYPPEHLPLLHKYVYEEILKDGRWKFDREEINGYLTVLQRI